MGKVSATECTEKAEERKIPEKIEERAAKMA